MTKTGTLLAILGMVAVRLLTTVAAVRAQRFRKRRAHHQNGQFRGARCKPPLPAADDLHRDSPLRSARLVGVSGAAAQ